MAKKHIKILHLAPFNTAGVPITFVKAERELGYESRLMTMGRHPAGYDEDICLNLPLLNFPGLDSIKRILRPRQRSMVSNLAQKPDEIPPKWRTNRFEKTFFNARELLWNPIIQQVIEKYAVESYDVIQLDGGLEFYRDGRFIKRLKEMGKKIICCYLGSDLRVRGVIPGIDALSDLNITDEFDHLQLHPDIHHIFFPFDWRNFKSAPKKAEFEPMIIGHAPTNRLAKGSDIIIPIVRELEKNLPIQLLLIEKMSYGQALKQKSRCDIFIDQIGDLGYGINSLEALAMEIPVCSCLAPGFAEKYPDHPFIVVEEHNLKDKLIELIHSENMRKQMGSVGRKWIIKHHDAVSVVKRIHKLAGIS
jgi:hypothetical protein